MKTALYELTPEDHLSPDDSQERVTDPIKAAHMGHAAHNAFRTYDAESDAHSLMRRWHVEGDTPHDTAGRINQAAEARTSKRAYDSGNFSALNIHGEPKRTNGDRIYFEGVEGVDQDMVIADQAAYIADYAVHNKVSVSSVPKGTAEGRDEIMDSLADRAGNRYDHVMRKLSKYKDEDLNN